MSVQINVSVDASASIASLEAKTKALLERGKMHGSISKVITELTRGHLNSKYVPNEKRGTTFWADVRDGITATATDRLATITLNEPGVALRYYGSGGLPGGGVTPGKSISSYTGKLTRALAIPTEHVPVSGGRQVRPGRAGLLAFIESATRGGETVGFLVEAEERSRKRATKYGPIGSKYNVPKPGGNLMFVLRTITRHKPDKNILPKDQELIDTAAGAIAAHIATYET